MIRNIVFDIGNVLTDFGWESFFKSFGISEEVFEKMAKATVLDEDWAEYDKGVLSDEQIVQNFVDNDPSVETEIRRALANLTGLVTRRDYAIPWIQALQQAGYKVYYLSNFSRKAEAECADALDFIPYMDGGILSYKEKLIKPQPEIYTLLLERYGLKAEECVFLDDTVLNLEAAKKQGIHTIHFTDKQMAEKELGDLGVIY